jgi:hypothetical protein
MSGLATAQRGVEEQSHKEHTMAQAAHENAIRPFHVNVPEAELAELRRRVNPTAHGASASDAFHLVIPSMPGYGFSGKPTTTGWGPERIARAWAELMKRLGDTKYVAQDGDWGALIVHLMGVPGNRRQPRAGRIGGRSRGVWDRLHFALSFTSS